MPPGRATLSKLDAWTIVERTSKEEAGLALGLDLRELALQDIDEISSCRSLRVALLSANLFTGLGLGVFACTRLRKLDLAKNGLTSLPTRDDWAKLPLLQILYLHENQLASLHSVGELVGLVALVRLTLFDNPLSRHPSYRHYCVNSLLPLRALDLHVISDEELIEGAHFSPNLATKCPAASLPLFQPPPPTQLTVPPRDEELEREVRRELAALNHTHARLSPVLKLQAVARRIGPRRILVAHYRQKERMGEAKEYAKDKLTEEAAEEEARRAATAAEHAHKAPEVDKELVRETLHRERAAITVQAHFRGDQQRKLLTGRAGDEARAHHEANIGDAPFLYVQARHVQELEALLAGALGTAAKDAYFEPTDCYTIRHATESPDDLANPQLAGLLIRQRALSPGLLQLRLTPNPNEARVLRGFQRRYVRPTGSELKVIKAASEFEDAEVDAGVQAVYARRQLCRLILPDTAAFAPIFSAVQRRNDRLLDQMGLADADANSPKVPRHPPP